MKKAVAKREFKKESIGRTIGRLLGANILRRGAKIKLGENPNVDSRMAFERIRKIHPELDEVTRRRLGKFLFDYFANNKEAVRKIVPGLSKKTVFVPERVAYQIAEVAYQNFVEAEKRGKLQETEVMELGKHRMNTREGMRQLFGKPSPKKLKSLRGIESERKRQALLKVVKRIRDPVKRKLMSRVLKSFNLYALNAFWFDLEEHRYSVIFNSRLAEKEGVVQIDQIDRYIPESDFKIIVRRSRGIPRAPDERIQLGRIGSIENLRTALNYCSQIVKSEAAANTKLK